SHTTGGVAVGRSLAAKVFDFLLGIVFLFFFFQAEDGIRDGHVTGVQTCALPISSVSPASARPHHGVSRNAHAYTGHQARWHHARSEERRVGKECRSRWSPYD